MLLAGTASAQADDLPAEPMLRIDAQRHIAQIKRIATDAKERFAVTASDDKTVRVWSLPDGKLERTTWLPSGDGDLGKAYAAALSPDGATIAVGGWTATSGLDGNIYLFDRASGALLQRLSGLPNVVLHLAFSPDGRRLVAAVWGANGIRVFDAGDSYRPLPSDSDYGDDSYWVDFAGDGRLVSASDDGFVRLYAAGHYDRPAVPKARVKGIARPRSVAFSPDGQHVAVGDHDSATVAILRARDLTPELFPSVAGFSDTGLKVAWSKDGQSLFAGGYHAAGHADRLARRWDKAGSGKSVDMAGARDTVMQFVSLSGQRMLFADAAGFGVINGAGKAARLQDLGSIDVRRPSAVETLLVSTDTRTVQIVDNLSKHLFRFDLARRAVALDPSPSAKLPKPTTESDRIRLSEWENNISPKLNGLPLVLGKNERSRSAALVPGTDRSVLGADWSLRLFDSQGNQVWSRAPSPP